MDMINRQAAIDAIDHVIAIGDEQLIGFRDDTAAMLTWQLKKDAMNVIKYRIKELPSAEPFFDKGKVSNLLYHIYSICSPHTNAMDVAARNFYFEELGKELFGDDIPEWMQR